MILRDLKKKDKQINTGTLVQYVEEKKEESKEGSHGDDGTMIFSRHGLDFFYF